MNIGAMYSHQAGIEYITYHHPELWEEVKWVIAAVDAESCKTKVSKEIKTKGVMLYSPIDMNIAFKALFEGKGWSEQRNTFWVTDDEEIMRRIYTQSSADQKQAIVDSGREAIMSYNQTDFIKDRVAIEVQFGKYSFVAHDLFVKHLSFYTSGLIDLGIEILPMKILERQMSSGVPYYERDLLNVIRQGKGVPPVPLILIGLEP